jgi:sugar/nucleoside kinase (ribokinase family)
MSILVVGSVAFDSISTPFGNAPEILGGSASYFSVAASYFAPVRLVAVVGEDFDDQHLEPFILKSVDVRGLEKVPGQTFRWGGEYSHDMNERTTLYTHLNVFADFAPKIHSDYLDSQYVFLGNIDPQLQRDVLSQIPKPRMVACDTMNFWISRQRESLLETLKLVDILLINDQEVRQLSGEFNLLKAASRVLEMGPKTLVIKRGEYGALMISEKGLFWVPALLLEQVFDPTGAGDSFAGGFVGYLASKGILDEAHLRRAAVYGSVMASFTVERFGLQGILNLSQSEIDDRFNQFRQLTHFTES